MVFEGQIVLVFEGVEAFLDPETQEESSLKFWLPRVFPSHVRVLVSASPGSRSAKYLRELGCHRISITADKQIVRSTLDGRLKKLDSLLVSAAHLDRLVAILRRKLDSPEASLKMIFVKSLLSLLAPEAYRGVEDLKIERSLFAGIFAQLRWEELESKLG